MRRAGAMQAGRQGRAGILRWVWVRCQRLSGAGPPLTSGGGGDFSAHRFAWARNDPFGLYPPLDQRTPTCRSNAGRCRHTHPPQEFRKLFCPERWLLAPLASPAIWIFRTGFWATGRERYIWAHSSKLSFFWQRERSKLSQSISIVRGVIETSLVSFFFLRLTPSTHVDMFC